MMAWINFDDPVFIAICIAAILIFVRLFSQGGRNEHQRELNEAERLKLEHIEVSKAKALAEKTAMPLALAGEVERRQVLGPMDYAAHRDTLRLESDDVVHRTRGLADVEVDKAKALRSNELDLDFDDNMKALELDKAAARTENEIREIQKEGRKRPRRPQADE